MPEIYVCAELILQLTTLFSTSWWVVCSCVGILVSIALKLNTVKNFPLCSTKQGFGPSRSTTIWEIWYHINFGPSIYERGNLYLHDGHRGRMEEDGMYQVAIAALGQLVTTFKVSATLESERNSLICLLVSCLTLICESAPKMPQ